MHLQIFQASGGAEIGRLQDEINHWLEETYRTILRTDMAVCSVGDDGDEKFQHLVVAIWYGPPSASKTMVR